MLQLFEKLPNLKMDEEGGVAVKTATAFNHSFVQDSGALRMKSMLRAWISKKSQEIAVK